MSAIEIAFFTAAFAIPLVGGSVLLYVLSRADKRDKKSDEKSDEKKP